MKREFLEELGLVKDQIDAVMSEYGRSLEAIKLKNTELENALRGCEDINNEKMRLERELTDERSAFSAFRSAIINDLVSESRPSSALAKKELIRLLEGCSTGNLRKVLDETRISDPDAFSNASDHPIFSAFSKSEEVPSPISFVRRR